MSEDWKKIEAFDNFSVSSLGRIRNDVTGRMRKTTKQKYGMGYHIVCLKKPGSQKTLYVHHLVAKAFKGPVPVGQEIRHRDGKVDHNEDSNLCFGTRKQNLDDKQAHGTQTRGEAHQTAKLCEADVLAIRLRYPGETQAALAAEFRVHLMTVNKIVLRRTWKHI